MDEVQIKSNVLPPSINLRRFSGSNIKDFLQKIGEPPYRLKQIQEWIWVKGEISFDRMSNLNRSLIKKLKENFHLHRLIRDYEEVSTDGTVKMRFRTEEGYYLESVYIPALNRDQDRHTLCVSSQVGCSLNCRFCATAGMDKKRNLFFDEIFDQFLWGQEVAQIRSGSPLTNIVFMGMGEPLLNYVEVLRAISLISYPQSFDYNDNRSLLFPWKEKSSMASFSPKRITLSTAGITDGIRRLGDDCVPFELALSLHAPTDDKRSQIMINNSKNNLNALYQALHYFYKKTGSKITLEYLLLNNFNDGEKDARELVRFYRKVPAKLVNVIEFNPVPGINFIKPSMKTFDRFVAVLGSQGINVKVRRSRGQDIAAACGQLARNELNL